MNINEEQDSAGEPAVVNAGQVNQSLYRPKEIL